MEQKHPVDIFAQALDYLWNGLGSSRTKEELDQVVEPFVQAKRQTGQWTQEDEAGYQLYRQEIDPKKRTFRVWYLIANPRGLPKELVQSFLLLMAINLLIGRNFIGLILFFAALF